MSKIKLKYNGQKQDIQGTNKEVKDMRKGKKTNRKMRKFG